MEAWRFAWAALLLFLLATMMSDGKFGSDEEEDERDY